MASLAIDPTEIRTPTAAPTPEADEKPGRRNAVVVTAGVAVVLSLVGAGSFAAYAYLPRSLSGLGIVGDGPKVKRREVRIGPLPDMPEIRNGVPEVVGSRAPVRIIPTATPGPVAAAQTAAPEATAGSAPTPAKDLPAAGDLPKPVNVMVPAAPSVPSAADLLVAATRSDRPRPSTMGELASAPPNAPTNLLSPMPTGATPRPAKPVSSAEPVATASIAADAPAATAASPSSAIPLPPVRSVARKAEPRQDRPAAQVTARSAPSSAHAENSADAQPPASAGSNEEDRVEILGMKLPNGRDFQNVVSSIGDAVTSLPKKF